MTSLYPFVTIHIITLLAICGIIKLNYPPLSSCMVKLKELFLRLKVTVTIHVHTHTSDTEMDKGLVFHFSVNLEIFFGVFICCIVLNELFMYTVSLKVGFDYQFFLGKRKHMT